MKYLPGAILILSCLGAAASAPAFSGEHAMPEQLGMHVGGHAGLRPRDLALNEAQEQKAFAIRHAEEPLRFEQHAALRKAHEGLRAMVESGRFDDARAAELSQTIGKAEAALALSHARAEARFLALLTPEQRARMQGEAPQPMPPR